MARHHIERHGGGSEERGYVCTDPGTITPRTQPRKASRLECTATSKTPPQAITTCTGCTASTCRYLTKSICTHAVQRSRSRRPSSRLKGTMPGGIISHHRTGTVVMGSYESYYAYKKEDASRTPADKDHFALRSRSRNRPYYRITLYILASFPYIL